MGMANPHAANSDGSLPDTPAPFSTLHKASKLGEDRRVIGGNARYGVGLGSGVWMSGWAPADAGDQSWKV